MAKKKAAKGKGKQAVKKGGPKKATPSRKTKARKVARKPHGQIRLGMSRNGANPPPMHVGTDYANTFYVYGDRIGVNLPNKTVRLHATGHSWDPPTQVVPSGGNGLRITAICRSTITGGGSNGTDDLTVTIDLGGTPETDCTYEDVEYDA